MTVDDVREIRAAAGCADFDICLSGRERPADWDADRAYIRGPGQSHRPHPPLTITREV